MTDENQVFTDWFAPYVIRAREREERAGGPILGVPSVRDMEFLYAAFESLKNCDDQMTPSNLHALMELLADVRDGWVDPETDELGRELFPVLSAIHEDLGKSMDEAVPENKELREKVENLRALQRAVRRRTAQRGPSLLTTAWNSMKKLVKRQ